MTDIFISYASEDRPIAQRIAGALSNKGWTVWWDRTILPGKTFDEVIEQALEASKCVIVVWSQAAISSEWVRAEAGEGLKRKVLIPVRIGGVQPPLAFRQIHAADLMGWDGNPTHAGFPQLVEALTSMLGMPVDQELEEAAKKVEDATKTPAVEEKVLPGAPVIQGGSQDKVGDKSAAVLEPYFSIHRLQKIMVAVLILLALVLGTGYGVSSWYEFKADQKARVRAQEVAAQAAAKRAAAKRAAAERAAAERAAAKRAAAERAAAKRATAKRAAAERARRVGTSIRTTCAEGKTIKWWDVDELSCTSTRERNSQSDFWFKSNNVRQRLSFCVDAANGATYAPKQGGRSPWEVSKAEFVTRGCNVPIRTFIPCVTSQGYFCSFAVRLDKTGRYSWIMTFTRYEKK